MCSSAPRAAEWRRTKSSRHRRAAERRAQRASHRAASEGPLSSGGACVAASRRRRRSGPTKTILLAASGDSRDAPQDPHERVCRRDDASARRGGGRVESCARARLSGRRHRFAHINTTVINVPAGPHAEQRESLFAAPAVSRRTAG